MKKTVPLLIITSILIAGCSPTSSRTPEPAKQPAAPSTLKTMVDGATGAQAVRSGKKAGDQLRSISADRDAELNEILDNK